MAEVLSFISHGFQGQPVIADDVIIAVIQWFACLFDFAPAAPVQQCGNAFGRYVE